MPAVVAGGCTLGVFVVLLVTGVATPAALAVVTMVPAAVIDVRERRLPDGWVAAAAAVLVTSTALSWALGSQAPSDTTIGAMFAGALAMAAPLLVLHLVSPAAMGFGDVKAGVVLGAALGSIDWRLGLVALTVGAAAGALIGLVRRSSTIAFGPFLVGGAVVALAGESIWLDALLDGGVR